MAEERKEGIVIAHIARAWGIKGEVIADLHTDFPDRFDDVEAVTLRRGATEREAVLEGYRFHKGRVLLKFEGVDTMSDAELLAGFDVRIDEAELYELPEGDDLYWEFDLVGCRVETVDGETVGEVEALLGTDGGDILSVRRSDGKEVLIPFVDEICPTVDVEAKRIVVDPPEGLFDL
jgi:16S rRNA processing protein RimM